MVLRAVRLSQLFVTLTVSLFSGSLFSGGLILPAIAWSAEHPSVPGEFIVKFRSTTASRTQAAHRATLGVQLLQQTKLTGSQLVRRTEGVEYNDAYAKQLLAEGIVEYIEPNYIVSIVGTPNDTRYSELWGLNNTGQTGGTSDFDIDAPEAWNITTGSSTVVVGVVDTGINYNHPDLAQNMWRNPGEIAGNGVDDDANGVIDDVFGFNAINASGNPLDDNSHGSHCAGTIGGQGNNALGVAGVNWTVKLMALKFLSAAGSGTTQDAISAIDYAVRMKNRGINIRVLSNSWGGGGYSQALDTAVAAANSAGILFVAAAGNSSSDNDVTPSYPANYEQPNVLSVASIEQNGNLSSFSNYGQSTVDLAAPGSNILSTVLGTSYASYSGTSMATPHVAGVAALVIGREPNLSAASLRSRLIQTTKPLSTLNGVVASGGLLNAHHALTNTQTPAPPPQDLLRYQKTALSELWNVELGERVLNVDDGYADVTLGFQFPYFQKNFGRVAVSANGRIIPLNTGDALPTEQDYSNRLGAGINVYHDDLYPSPFSNERGVWFKNTGTAAIFTWVATTYQQRDGANAQAEIRFQAKLFGDGHIEFHYHDTLNGDSLYDFGASATVGLVPPIGVSGARLSVSHNTANSTDLGSGHALKFTLGNPRAQLDFDGDGKSDIAVWRPTTAIWFILYSGKNYDFAEHKYFQLGLPGDTPLAGDFDGDGLADLAVWRPSNGTWYLKTSSTGFNTISAVQWGLFGDIPLVGDFDGDGKSDLTVYRGSSGMFYVLLSTSGFNRSAALTGNSQALLSMGLGGVGHDPVVGDFTGDGRDDFVTVWQPARFWNAKDQSGQLLFSLPWGYPGDTPLACDWDGNGTSDRVIVRVEQNYTMGWYVVSSTGFVYLYNFGSIGDTPRCDRDFDGDGLADMAVFRNGTGEWFIRKSATGALMEKSFGLAGDVAL